MAEYYPDELVGVRVFLEALAERYGAQIDLRPELGFPRTHANDPKLMALAHEAVELGVFQSIDLYSLGLTQTRFGKKADASDSASETVKREVAEARGPRRTDACCVSPTDID